MSDERLDYSRMVREALRAVVREALTEVAREGLPGAHHFFLSFRTAHPGVVVPAFLRERYPEEITVVLQHQFWDLEVEDAEFSITLSFGGRQERLTVPFAALTAFVDPTAEFGLRFEAPGEPDESAAGAAAEPGAEPAAGAGQVVSLDKFRKK